MGAASLVSAQTQDPQFDAVSIRRVESSGAGRGPISAHIEGGRVQLHRYSLLSLVTMAYKFSYIQVVWPKNDHEAYYDVEAVMPSDTSDEQRILMLQNMLRARLAFRAHHEVRPLPSFVLLVSPKGLKLEKAEGPSDPTDIRFGRLWSGPSEFSVNGNLTMGKLTEMFSPNLGGPFLDKTGLQGYYTFHLSIPRERNIPDSNISPNDYTPEMLLGLSGWDNGRFISALEKQTGLRAEPRAVDTNMLVVDSFHLDPTEN